MFLNKHYEIPFVKECVARFPLPYSVKPATGYIAKPETPHKAHSVTIVAPTIAKTAT